MIQKYRKQFNEEFSPEKYQKLIETLEKSSGTTNGFRQSESPIFLSKDFKNKLTDACDSIISQVKTFSNEELQKAIQEQSEFEALKAKKTKIDKRTKPYREYKNRKEHKLCT